MITITISTDRSITASGTAAGIDGENNVTELSVTVPEAYAGYDKYVEFQTSDGTKVMSPALGNGAAAFSYAIPEQVLIRGILKVQITCKSGEMVWKSNVAALAVKEGIDATEYVVNASPDVLQDLLERMTAAEEAETDAVADAQQVMSDMLAMLGTDIATLTDGKLTASQIPALSINDVFDVADTDEMLALDAQRGDCALIITGDVVSDSYILSADDPATFSNWKKLGVSYVANAGHANTADEAVNATTINNKRIIGMTQSQYDGAALDDDTFYFVVPDPEE